MNIVEMLIPFEEKNWLEKIKDELNTVIFNARLGTNYPHFMLF